MWEVPTHLYDSLLRSFFLINKLPEGKQSASRVIGALPKQDIYPTRKGKVIPVTDHGGS
jgi:hypothetical protein